MLEILIQRWILTWMRNENYYFFNAFFSNSINSDQTETSILWPIILLSIRLKKVRLIKNRELGREVDVVQRNVKNTNIQIFKS